MGASSSKLRCFRSDTICKSSISSFELGRCGEAAVSCSHLPSLPCCRSTSRNGRRQRAPDTMAARVLACASCHGAQGEGTSDVYFPRLAGKPAGYLYNQLVAFRGRPAQIPADELSAGVSARRVPEGDGRILCRAAAADFRRLPPPTVSNEILARGESLVTSGDPQRGIPACAGCHGPTLGGMEPAIPGLLGLRASYISAQLGALALRHANRRRARLHADRRRPPDRRRRQGGGRLSRVAAGAGGPVVCAARQPADAACLRQPAELKGDRAYAENLASSAPGSGAVLAAGRRDAGAGRRMPALHREGRISRPRRRLHRLPHRARGQDLRRRPADADAVRHALHVRTSRPIRRPASASGRPTSSTG